MSSSVVAKRIGPPEPAEDRAPASTIQHISPVVLDTLRELSVPVRQRYRDLFDEYWGRPCGRRINDVLYCATSVDSDDLKLLYVRQDYARAWTALQGRLAAGLSKGVVWEGQPGIGKSLGLRYLLLRSFETCSPVIYCPNPNKDVYIFCNQGVFQIPQNAWDHFKYLITPIFLLDSPPKNTDIPMDLYNGAPYPICLATSPQWSRYHEFKKQTKADFLVLDLVHKSELREFMIATVDLEEKRGDPHVVRLDDDHSLSDPIVNNDLDDPKHSSPSLSIKTSKPSTRLTPASSAASEAPDPSSSAAVSDNSTPHRQPEADDSGDSDSETTTPASSFIPLPDYVEKYWADWASTNKFWHPIDVFRLAGPSFRAPFFGHARATSDFCLDYIGGPVHTVPVTALSELYRVMANCRSSTSSGGADPNTFLQLRPEAQASHFHLFFFEEPLTKELSSGVIPPSQYILPTDWLCEIVIAAIAEVEADAVREFARSGITIKSIDDESVTVVPPLPIRRILPERNIPLNEDDYLGLPPERNPTWDCALVVPSRKLFVLVQITVSSEHPLKPGGLKMVEKNCDSQSFKQFDKHFVFATPDEGSAQNLAKAWDGKRKKRSSSGRSTAPAGLKKYQLGYAAFSQDEITQQVHANLVETSPPLAQGAFV